MKKNIVVIGAGVTGLVCARMALARGHGVTVVAHHTATATTSGMSAGMVAPALEALNDGDPVGAFNRLKAAQNLWREDLSLWPDPVTKAIITPSPSRFVWPKDDQTDYGARFAHMGAQTIDVKSAPEGFYGLDVAGEWLFPAGPCLEALLAAIQALGATVAVGDVAVIGAGTLSLSNGQTLSGDALFVAGGYLNEAIRCAIPVLSDLMPIKGHVLLLPKIADDGVVRAPFGYLASLGERSIFGATMQNGQGDFEIEPEVVESLKAKARALGVTEVHLKQAVPKVGVRAAFADGWPKMQWVSDHLFIAAGMRRNGFVFAPLAAKTFLHNL
jgi:glycine oxidase